MVGVILVFVIFVWEKVFGFFVEEKCEIGIFKVIGWEIGDVIWMKLWEGLFILLIVFLFGFIVVYVYVFYFGVLIFELVFKGWLVFYLCFMLLLVVDGL